MSPRLLISAGIACLVAASCAQPGTEGDGPHFTFGPGVDAGNGNGAQDSGSSPDGGDERVDAGDSDAGTEPELDGGMTEPMDAGFAEDAGESADAGRFCDSKTQFIYTIAQDNTLSTFYPPNLSFSRIGQVRCGNALLSGSPFSMAVDRYADIWSVFTTGKLFRINPINAACTSTSFTVGQHGFITFGMGFSSNTPGGWDETLYVSNSDGSGLGKIDTTNYRLSTIGSGYPGLTGSGITGRAELSGTGDAKLFGAFEGAPFEVNEIDKTNGTILSSAVQSGVTSGSSGSNFAFASWAGDFYLFVGPGTSTNVYLYSPTTGTTRLVTHTNLVIVGAGVSTCAPSGQ